MLTHERLTQLIHYSPSTGAFTWVNRPGRWGRQRGGPAGSINASGYRQIGIDGKIYRCCRLAVFYMRGAWPAHEVDHINRDSCDDSWENLRDATRLQNAQNRGAVPGSKSGIKGVFPPHDGRQWTSRISVKKKRLHLGTFQTRGAAEAAYIQAAKEHFGCFAPLAETVGAAAHRDVGSAPGRGGDDQAGGARQ